MFFADDSLYFFKRSSQSAHRLKDTLEEYCEASSQTVNLGKSCLYFNASMRDSLKTDITRVLGVNQVENPSHYLDLPTVWGRSRRDALSYLKKRIRQKLQGWKNWLLNNAVREVLIKSIITSIPTYAMNVFQLPSTWCVEINTMISRFWWAQGMGKGKYIGSYGI